MTLGFLSLLFIGLLSILLGIILVADQIGGLYGKLRKATDLISNALRPQRRRQVYIAGKMRGLPDHNFPAFDAAAALGRALGWIVFSPAEMDRKRGITKNSPDPSSEEMDEIIREDVEIILDLQEIDAVAVLPDWKKSGGARAEVALALWRGLPILDATTFQPLEVGIAAWDKKFVPHREACCLRPDDAAEIATVTVAKAMADGTL